MEPILLVIIGTAFIIGGWLYAPAKFKALAVIIGLIAGGYGILGPGGFYEYAPEEAAIVGAALDITPNNGSYDPGAGTTHAICAQTVADDEESCTVQVRVDLSLDTFRANYSSFNFTINPVAPPGAKNDDLITVYFSIDEDYKYGGEEVFYESSNVRQAVWSIEDSETTSNYEGSTTMLYTDTHWVELRVIWDGKGSGTLGEEMDTVGESFDIPVNFWTDGGYTWTYTITVICIHTVA